MIVTTFVLCIAGLVVSAVILGATRMALLAFFSEQRPVCGACGRTPRANGDCAGCRRDASLRTSR